MDSDDREAEIAKLLAFGEALMRNQIPTGAKISPSAKSKPRTIKYTLQEAAVGAPQIDRYPREFFGTNYLCKEPKVTAEKEADVERMTHLFNVPPNVEFHSQSGEVLILHYHAYNEACYANGFCKKVEPE